MNLKLFEELRDKWRKSYEFGKSLDRFSQVCARTTADTFGEAADQLDVAIEAARKEQSVFGILKEHNYFYQEPYGDRKTGFYYCLCGWEGPDRDSYWKHLPSMEPPALPEDVAGAIKDIRTTCANVRARYKMNPRLAADEFHLLSFYDTLETLCNALEQRAAAPASSPEPVKIVMYDYKCPNCDCILHIPGNAAPEEKK
jgi:hypothetical protein